MLGHVFGCEVIGLGRKMEDVAMEMSGCRASIELMGGETDRRC